MTIAAERITPAALQDMMEMFHDQPWTKDVYSELATLWQICDTRPQQDLLKFLVKRFVVLDSKLEVSTFEGLNSKFQEWGLVPGNTFVVAVADGDEVDGSTAGLQKLKNKISPVGSWHQRFIANIPAVSSQIKNGNVVVLFDDFVGSGKKFCDKINWLLKIATDNKVSISIKAIAFAGMEFGVKRVRDDTGVEIFVPNLLKKGISEMKPPAEVAAASAVMDEIEAKLAPRINRKKLRNFLFGYGRSECLYFAMNDNCPNNVFPIFWWPMLADGGALPTVLKRVG